MLPETTALQLALANLHPALALRTRGLLAGEPLLPPAENGLLEISLAGDTGGVDFSRRYSPQLPSALKDWLASHSSESQQSLIQLWQSKQGHWSDIGLEFDLNQAQPGTPATANVFVRPTPSCAAVRNLPALVESLRPVSALHSRNLPSLEHLTALAQSLPETTHVSYLGLMLARPGQDLRVQAGALTTGEIYTFLAQSGRDCDALSRALDFAQTHFDTQVLCFDTDGEIGPRIGLELFGHDLKAGRFDEVLSAMSQHHWIDEPLAEAVLDWPARLDPGALAAAWRSSDDTVRPGTHNGYLLRRHITHIKLVINDNSVTAKAYLAFQPEKLPLRYA